MGYIVDLSKWQGDIDFGKLSKVVDMVILRVQAGSTYIDPKYKEYVTGCKKYNIPFGTYAYFKGVNIQDSIEEAKDAYSRMDKDSKFFALDVEEMTLTIPLEIIPASQAFIDYMKQQGVKRVGLYSGEYFYRHYDLSKIKCDFLWMAKYSSNKPAYACDIWQYASSGVAVSGIKGNVDVNKLNGNKTIDWFIGKEQVPQPKVVQPVGQWKKENSIWFYYDNGKKRIGWLNENGNWYYLKEGTGQMVSNWYQVAGKWYFFYSSGIMATGWVRSMNKYYYLNEKGQMLTGKQTINGKVYTFDNKGALVN
jgi:GH25 family lysozyme M1 (1,4-beta-N-acetylmuramidase)